MTGLDLASYGLIWLRPAVDCAHPLDDGSAGVLYRSIERTVDGMGRDGQRWRRVFAPMVSRFDDLFADASQPVLRVPRHPLALARFGTAAMLPAAPTLFSTMMVRLANGRTFSPKYRTSTSAPLPAGKPQMKRISWLG